jgi:lysozyme family protein
MKDLTEEMAIWVYRTAWWDRLRLDDILKIYPFIADRLFDFGINAGRGAAGTNIQRILNVMNRMQQDYKDIKPDGAIGDGTVDALKAYVAKRGQVGILNMIQLLIDLQGAYYIQVAEKRELNETFMSGWTTRLREANELYQRIFQAK